MKSPKFRCYLPMTYERVILYQSMSKESMSKEGAGCYQLERAAGLLVEAGWRMKIKMAEVT